MPPSILRPGDGETSYRVAVLNSGSGDIGDNPETTGCICARVQVNDLVNSDGYGLEGVWAMIVGDLSDVPYDYVPGDAVKGYQDDLNDQTKFYFDQIPNANTCPCPGAKNVLAVWARYEDWTVDPQAQTFYGIASVNTECREGITIFRTLDGTLLRRPNPAVAASYKVSEATGAEFNPSDQSPVNVFNGDFTLTTQVGDPAHHDWEYKSGDVDPPFTIHLRVEVDPPTTWVLTFSRGDIRVLYSLAAECFFDNAPNPMDRKSVIGTGVSDTPKSGGVIVTHI
jgi:hypothetical protein